MSTSLLPTEDQALVARAVRALLAGRASTARLRALRDGHPGVEGAAEGWSRALWRELGEQGLLGLALPEAHGGSGLPFFDLALCVEELGAALLPEPWLGTLLLGAPALVAGGTAGQRERWLPAVARGEATLALADHEPGARWDAHAVATRAVPSPAGGFRLEGEKRHVADGHTADAFVVPARTAGGPRERAGITLFLVERGAPGLTVRRERRIDGRGAASLILAGVEVGPDALVGEQERGAEVLDPVLDRARAGLAAEMVGGAARAFELTLEYLRTREQFGVKIGTFQALRHRAARVFSTLELARSAVRAAARAVDGPDARERARMASLAKHRAGDAYILAAAEGVQLHGGVGVTDEADIGLYLKRARAADATLGDSAYHVERWAELSGY